MPDETGIIYVLTNECMPGLIKIGCTAGSVEDRVYELGNKTGVPMPFECHFAARLNDYKSKERTLHQLFGEQRVNAKREFFRLAPEKVVLAIRMGAYTDVTPGKITFSTEDERALEQAVLQRTRRSNIRLVAIGIYPGAILTFSRDQQILAVVVEGNKVNFEGHTTSLSAAALTVLQRLGSRTQAASGSDYWMYDGKTLDEIRIIKEAENEDAEQREVEAQSCRCE